MNEETMMNAIAAELSDEIAQQITDTIGEHFAGDRDYWPQLMDADWDGGSGRVIVWEECPVADWAYLAGPGGVSEYGGGVEYEPVPLPAGVWVEPVNPMTLRVMPR